MALSTPLRHWFGHKPERWKEFRKRYRAEITKQPKKARKTTELRKKGAITWLFAAAARDELHNDAFVVRELLLIRQPAGKAEVKTIRKKRRRT